MVKEIDNIPYKDRPWGSFAIKQITNTKQRLGMGNFTLHDLSEELNKGIINKFERKKVIINYIDEIHSCDLVDMTKYSRVNRAQCDHFQQFHNRCNVKVHVPIIRWSHCVEDINVFSQISIFLVDIPMHIL